VVYDRKAAAGKMAFMGRMFAHLFGASSVNLVICGHINLLPAAWLASRLRGARLVLIIHGIESWERPSSLLSRRLAGGVDAFISVSRFSAEKFGSWSGVSMERGFTLPNGFDLDRFQSQKRYMKLLKRYGLQSSRVILTVGRLESRERYKGIDQVIEVMPFLIKRFPNLKYLIVGDGSDRVRLEAKAASLGLAADVIFAGHVPESEKVAHYNLADAYVMPSRAEGFGIVLIEAAACGIPVVGSKIDGSRETLLDGQLGRLVDPKRPEELVQALTELLERMPARRRAGGIEFFSAQKFEERVADWCRVQAVSVAGDRSA
jgi:glycosyltransferase involved in cell wall biosynthesis